MTDYAQGFKDGFAAGLEEGKKIANGDWMDGYIEGTKRVIPPPYVPPIDPFPTYVKDTCPKCGMTLGPVMGYVCASPNCPTFPQVTCDVSKPMTAGQAVASKAQSWLPSYNVRDYIDRPQDLREPGNYMDLERREDIETSPSGYR